MTSHFTAESIAERSIKRTLINLGRSIRSLNLIPRTKVRGNYCLLRKFNAFGSFNIHLYPK